VATDPTNWPSVAGNPQKMKHLKSLLAYYRKFPHPFTKCVADNTKRFGPERAKRICAVVKDINEKGTDWRKGPTKGK
jgi:hypothetical protein